jgi:hypothetical protein
LKKNTDVTDSNGSSIATAVSNSGWSIPQFEMSGVNSNIVAGTVAVPIAVSNSSPFTKIYLFYKFGW